MRTDEIERAMRDSYELAQTFQTIGEQRVHLDPLPCLSLVLHVHVDPSGQMDGAGCAV